MYIYIDIYIYICICLQLGRATRRAKVVCKATPAKRTDVGEVREGAPETREGAKHARRACTANHARDRQMTWSVRWSTDSAAAHSATAEIATAAAAAYSGTAAAAAPAPATSADLPAGRACESSKAKCSSILHNTRG